MPREAILHLHSSDATKHFMETQCIEWHFQTVIIPHFDGTYELLVRSTKRALYAALEQERNVKRRPTPDPTKEKAKI